MKDEKALEEIRKEVISQLERFENDTIAKTDMLFSVLLGILVSIVGNFFVASSLNYSNPPKDIMFYTSLGFLIVIFFLLRMMWNNIEKRHSNIRKLKDNPKAIDNIAKGILKDRKLKDEK